MEYSRNTPILQDVDICIIVEDKSGRQAIKAKYFIDASGDGDLIYRAVFLSYKNSDLQPPTTVAIFDNLNKIFEENKSFNMMDIFFNSEYPESLKYGFTWGANVPGRSNSYMIAGTRVHNADCSDSESLTAAEIEARKQIRAISDMLKKYVKGGDKVTLANMSAYIGIRETRHARCLYSITSEDILSGRHFDDAIAYGTYGCDVHHSDKPGITMKYLDGTQKYM